ncbi:thermonuclease family protein [Elioraea tepidiphila]|uniref:thermonuclease family protein n=1 Tax=Elioraea tepidiphila TaxID=457934 RepID=UPI000367DCFB|nr:thermonuclease family protein [Elioraea tepidiphila]
MFRPRRRLLPGRWAVVLAVLVGVLGGVLLALDLSSPAPRGAPPPSAVFQRDLPAAAIPAPQPAPGTGGLIITGRASIIDGDTIEVRGRRIRLHGIDAPEKAQTCLRNGWLWECGRDATAALDRLIGGRTVTCTELDVDHYGRSVAQCLLNGQDVNAWMVRNGWAVAYRRFSDAYVGAEAEARAARRGIWSSRFEMPESHRHPGR